jgi:hypothetical protein
MNACKVVIKLPWLCAVSSHETKNIKILYHSYVGLVEGEKKFTGRWLTLPLRLSDMGSDSVEVVA